MIEDDGPSAVDRAPDAQHRLVAALVRGEARFHGLLDACPEAVFLRAGPLLTHANAACAQLFGAGLPADLVGQPVLGLFHAGDRAALAEALQVLDEGGDLAVPHLGIGALRFTGEVIPVEARATAFDCGPEPGAIVFLRDLRELQEAELERERLRLALEQSGDAILITDLEGSIRYVNRAFEQVTGYSSEEVVGANPRILNSGRQDAAFYRQMWATLTAGEVWRGRIVNRRKNGTTFTEDVTISPVRDRTDAVVGYVSAKRDVTSQIELQAQLQHADKMNAIGRLAGGIAHDFNNMLGVIGVYSQMALDASEPESQAHDDLTQVRVAVERASALVRRLLTFARKDIAVPKVVDLNASVSETLRMMGRLLRKDIELEWKPGEGVWPVFIDPAQLDQVLTNLLLNARDAISGVGRVTVETSNAEHPGDAMEPAHDHPRPFAVITVTDDGCGMEAAALSTIFEPFFSTKQDRGGTGLGLSIAHGVVYQSGGFIQVESLSGAGTTFRVHLPRHLERRASSQPPAAAALPVASETVLVVDDERAMLAAVRRVLTRHGYTVLSADEPLEALEIARRHPGTIDLLVTDVFMPKMDGRQLWDEIQTLRPDIPCLFISGYSNDVVTGRAVLEGDFDLVEKPFSVEALATRVRRALDDGRSSPAATPRGAHPGLDTSSEPFR